MDQEKKTILKVRKFKRKRASQEQKFEKKDKNSVNEIKLGIELLKKENGQAKLDKVINTAEGIVLDSDDLQEEIEIQDIKQLYAAGKYYEEIKKLEKYLILKSDFVKPLQSLHRNIRLDRQQKLEKIKTYIKGQPINDLELYYVRLLIADLNPQDKN